MLKLNGLKKPASVLFLHLKATQLLPKGIPIHGLNDIPEDILIFHAGTRKEKGQILTNGGRVLNVVSLGKDISSARKRVYDFLSEGTLHFENMQYRRDIASKADRWIS